MIPAWVQVLPLLTVAAATVGLLLGFALLAKEHHGSPCLQKAFTGLTLLALMFAADAAWTAASQLRPIDWRLTLFALGAAGAWACRLGGLTGRTEAKRAARRQSGGPQTVPTTGRESR